MMQPDLTALAAARAAPAQCVGASAARQGNIAGIGIGASAGGLQALESFLSNLPSDSGFAYVIVQHLDPRYESMLVDLLRHRMHMPVEPVQDGIQPMFRQPANLTPTAANDALFQKGIKLAESERRLPDAQAEDENLRASNEVHITSREELPALNLELDSNYQKLTRCGEQMKSMLEDLVIGLGTTDTALCVQHFNPQASQLFRLVPADIGRPLSDIFTNLAYPDIYDDLRMALHTRTVSEKKVATRDQRWFRVKIMPHRTVENTVDGVVLTFAECTAMSILEQPLLSLQSPGRTDVTGASHEN